MGIENIRALKEAARLPKPPKGRSPIAKVSEKRKKQIEAQKAIGTDKALDDWFLEIEKRHFIGGYGVCMECGEAIPVSYARHATAHLLPKKIFKSVSTHPLNYLILGAGCGCHEKTHRVDKFVQMRIWPEAAQRIKKMIPCLFFDERRHISEQLEMALDNT